MHPRGSMPTASHPKSLHLGNFSVRRKGRLIISPLELSLFHGTITVLIGANGAGKSTLLEAAVGLLSVEEGSQVLLRGVDITDEPSPRRIRRGLSIVPQGRGLFPNLPVFENLLLGSVTRKWQWRPRSRESVEPILNVFPSLESRLNTPAGLLSGGEQQMLAIGRALMNRPSVILLDEPLLGLSPGSSQLVADCLVELAENGVAILVTEEDLRIAQMVQCGRLFMSRGKIERLRLAGRA